jgi:hypothetical protein
MAADMTKEETSTTTIQFGIIKLLKSDAIA